MTNELVEHYAWVVRLVEEVIIAQVPRIPLVPAPRGLTDDERTHIAHEFARAHEVADQVAYERGYADGRYEN